MRKRKQGASLRDGEKTDMPKDTSDNLSKMKTVQGFLPQGPVGHQRTGATCPDKGGFERGGGR